MNDLAQICLETFGPEEDPDVIQEKMTDSWEDPSNESGTKCHDRSHQQRDGKECGVSSRDQNGAANTKELWRKVDIT